MSACSARGWHRLLGSTYGGTGAHNNAGWSNYCRDCGQAVALCSGSGVRIDLREQANR